MAGMRGMVGRFLEAAGNVIWDGHLLIKCPLSPSSNAATGKIARPAQLAIREPCQRNHVSHRLHAHLAQSDRLWHFYCVINYLVGSRLPQMDRACKSRPCKATHCWTL